MGRSQNTRLTKWAEAGQELPIRAAAVATGGEANNARTVTTTNLDSDIQ
jgi:hypothetical protein